MKYVRTEDEEWFSTESRDLNHRPIRVYNADGYGGCDIRICSHNMTWEQFDKLKEAMSLAEAAWRKPPKDNPVTHPAVRILEGVAE